ncbi:hypothetical protein CANINC_001205 [Pichia inconspicua]|uniref:Protein kinase domain-containing protein n=1 Tax=Pichia inconspicua TaxID=52247 RepID=A0A4T0X459_9ASCO|nr:hypothetical protein CANINC_001205 [[Candida] inconspicua]
MLDLFKNIINRKTKEAVEKEKGKEREKERERERERNDIDGSKESSFVNEDVKGRVDQLIREHPEYADYYKELSARYILQEKIGDGAFSFVFKAYDTKEKIIVAIKIIDKSLMKPDQINSVLKEIAIMRQLDHPNIIKLYSYFNPPSSKYCFLFLEYAEGGEIFNQIIKYTYFSENLTRHIFRQVVFAIQYLHHKGIVHRDIKPENLLFEPSTFVERSPQEQIKARRVSDDNNKVDEGKFSFENGAGGIGIIKLADFGLSTLLQTSQELAKTPCGTVGYTSPEQHMNVGYDKKVDMWTLGCVLYTMVVGFPPFYSNNQNPNDITEKVMKGNYQFLKPWFDEVSEGCKNLISNLLTVDPVKRYSIEQVLQDPWFNQGYESTSLRMSSPAEDAPQNTYDNALFKTFSEDLINKNNVDDYFTGRVNTEEVQVLTPRAEAIKLVFDTAKDVRRKNRTGIIDFICQKPTKLSTSSNSSSMSDLNSDVSSTDLCAVPIIAYDEHSLDEEEEDDDDEDEDDEDVDDDDEDEDDDNSSLDSENYDNTYPITLTSLARTKSPMIRRSKQQDSDLPNLTTVHSHATTATVVTHGTIIDEQTHSDENEHGMKNNKPRKTSISFSIDTEHSKRSGSITSDTSISHGSHNSCNSQVGSFNLANHILELNNEEDTTEIEYEDKTPSASMHDTTNLHLHKLSRSEFMAKCKAHTPYICKSSIDNIESVAKEVSLEEKMSQHGVVSLQLDSATILARRKHKVIG